MNPLLLPDSIEVAVGPQEDGPIEQGRCCHQRPLDEILRKLLELLIRSVDVAGWANRGFGQAAGYVWQCGELFNFKNAFMIPCWVWTNLRSWSVEAMLALPHKLPF
jgi:hypothetical protein